MADAKSNSRTGNDTPRPARAYALLLAVAVAYGLHALLISGPAMHAAAREQLERLVAEEDRDVCGGFGMRPGTPQFVDCSRELAIVRQRQADRDSAAALGI